MGRNPAGNPVSDVARSPARSRVGALPGSLARCLERCGVRRPRGNGAGRLRSNRECDSVRSPLRPLPGCLFRCPGSAWVGGCGRAAASQAGTATSGVTRALSHNSAGEWTAHGSPRGRHPPTRCGARLVLQPEGLRGGQRAERPCEGPLEQRLARPREQRAAQAEAQVEIQVETKAEVQVKKQADTRPRVLPWSLPAELPAALREIQASLRRRAPHAAGPGVPAGSQSWILG